MVSDRSVESKEHTTYYLGLGAPYTASIAI